jgi:transcriptional regulator with XRE-family HTH domain
MRTKTTATTMKIIKTIAIEVPGLGEKLKEARENDARTLKRICEEVGMSTQNWYRLEDEKQMIHIDTLRKIEQVLRVDFNIDF